MNSSHLKAVLTLLILSVPTAAHAALSVDATEVRSYDLPEGVEPAQAQIQATRDGTTVIAATTGDGAQMACTVELIDDQGATSYAYRYQDGPTACVGVLVHPDGGFFLRGAKADAQQGDVFGFTARVGADGTEMWAVADQDLVDAAAEADGGTGEFIGQYTEPHAEMAYSAEFDRLLAFTNANLNVGGGQRLTQAHVLSGDTGRIKVSGQTFGHQGGFGFIAETVSRTSDGYFLLYIYSAGSRGAYFFAYNGRNSVDSFKPLGEDWSTRYVRQMVYAPDDNVYLLWTPSDQPDAPTNITVVDDQASEVWSSSFEATGAQGAALGQPLAMWVGANEALVLYSSNQKLVLRVVDTFSGDELGVAPLAGVTDYSPVAILNGTDGGLKLLAAEQGSPTLHEFRLEFSQSADGGDAGMSDAGSGGSSSGGDGGGCTSGGPAVPAPMSAVALVFGLLAFGRAVFTIASR